MGQFLFVEKYFFCHRISCFHNLHHAPEDDQSIQICQHSYLLLIKKAPFISYSFDFNVSSSQ